MSNIPKDLKSKYNKDKKFIWVDAQLEKFMEKQKLDERKLKNGVYILELSTPLSISRIKLLKL